MASLSVIFKAVDEISSKMDAMASAGSKVMDKFDQIEDIADEAFSGITQGTDEAAEALDQAADSTDYWTDKIGNYNKEAMQAIYTIEELVEQGYMTEDALKEAADSTEEFGEKVEDAGKKSEEFGKKSEESGKKSEESWKKTQDAVIGLNDVLAAAGIVAALKAITSAFQESSEAAAEFETNVAKVSTVADTTALSADELSGQITDLSKETATSVNEIADATYNAISAGVDTANAVDTVRIATQLATSGFTDTTSALSVLTTIMNAYGMSADELTNVSDSLIQTQNNGVTTIDQLATSMGKAISTASAYSIDLYNLEAAYISTTKAGISTEESTTYLASMFKELGTSGTEVADIIQDQTGQSFGQLMQEGYSLADVLEMLYSSVNYDAEALMNLWSSAEAGKAANAVISQGLDTFNENLIALGNSAGTTETAYATMTDTSTYATERLQNSMSNLSIAIGDDLNPTVNLFKNGLADVTDGLAGLIEEHPAITALLTGAVVGLGSVTVAITAYTAATKLAAVATSALGTLTTAALGPLALVAVAIGAVSAAVIYFSDKSDDMTASTEKQYNELQDLNEEYERACTEYGETSEEASRLKYQIDDLTASYEANAQTLEEFQNEVDELCESVYELSDSWDEAQKSVSSSQTGTLALIQKYQDLTSQQELSEAETQALEAVTNSLAESYPDLAEQLDSATMSTEDYVEALKKACEQEAEEQMQQEAQETYVEALKKRAELTEKLEKAQENLNTELETTGYWWDEEQGQYTNGFLGTSGLIAQWTTNINEYQAAVDDVNAAMAENDALIAEIEEGWESTADAAEDSAEAATDGYEEAQTVLESYSAEIEELCEAYDEAYESALSSIQGQYSLWDEVEDVASMSSKNITDALQSQIDYWNSYNENMDSLTERASEIEGLSDMLAELADGSEDSAAMLAGMSEMNDADLSAVVQQYNDLQEAQSETASSVADLQTEFSEKLDEMQTEMDSMVDSMDMSEEAKANAKSTMDAYVSEIQSGVEKAQSAIDSLSFANTTLSTGGYKGYATGTVDAEPGLALVGEEGPELVNFGGGEVVYTADETANILSRDGVKDDLYVEPSESGESNEGGGDKTITLRIEGAGSLNVSSGVTKEEVWEMLAGNLKDAFMNIVQQEIMEEGDLAYEF